MQLIYRLASKRSYKYCAAFAVFILSVLIYHNNAGQRQKIINLAALKNEAYRDYSDGAFKNTIPKLTIIGSDLHTGTIHQRQTGVAGISRLHAGPFIVAGNTVSVTSSSNIKRVPRGYTALVMQKLGFSTDFATAKITALKITKIGTLDDSKISRIRIYYDKDGKGLIGRDDRQIGDGVFLAGKAYIVFKRPQLITTSPSYFLITYDILRNAPIGKTVGSRIASHRDIESADPDVIKKITGFSGNTAAICASCDKLSFTHDPPPDIHIEQGSNRIILDTFSLSAPSTGDGLVLSRLQINQIGTARDNDILSIELVDDLGAKGVLETSGDKTIGSTTFHKGTAAFSIPGGLTVDPGTSRHLIVTANLASNAKPHTTVQSKIANQTFVGIAGPDKIAPFINAAGRVITISDKPDIVAINQKPFNSVNAKIGTRDYPVQELALLTNEDSARIASLQLHLTGNLDTGNIKDIKLWLDCNNNKSVDNNDRILSTATSFPSRMAAFRNLDIPKISKSKGVQLLVTFTVASDSPTGKTFGCELSDESYATATSPDKTILASVPLRSMDITTIPEAPAKPQNVEITAESNRHISVSWNANRAKQNVTGYKIFRSKSKTGTFSQIGNTEIHSTKYVDALPDSGTFWYKIAAVNVSGESMKSAAQTTDNVQIKNTVSSADSTATIESVDKTVNLLIPKSKAYNKKTFMARSAIRPPGFNIKLASKYFFEFDTDAKEPFNPPLTIVLKCNRPVDDSVKIYHYKDNKWKPVSGGQYIYDGYYIGYTNITGFSGYCAAQTNLSSAYNNPLQYNDETQTPHGGYVNGTNKCKECHSIHLASGLYRLTRANERSEACDYCHGIGGLATKKIVLDENGHGIPEEASGEVIAPDDSYPPYSVSVAKWGCLECHSAHDNHTVQLAGFETDKLLKSNPNPGKTFPYYEPAVGVTTQTVSQWCTCCHSADFGPSSDAKAIDGDTDVFGHSSSGTGTTVDGDGHVVVDLADGVNNGPTCKQCHTADSRQDIASGFPHASGSAASLLSSDTASTKIDKNCRTCHSVESLP